MPRTQARLGRETASVTNWIMSAHTPKPPQVGMGATILHWTDRTACTVIEVLSPARIRIQEDLAIRTDTNGMSESQDYTYVPNPKGATYLCKLTTRKAGKGWRADGATVVLDVRQAYHDYSF